MTKTVKFETKVVIATGFHQGHRKYRGDEFSVPEDFTGSWFVPKGTPEAKAALEGEPNLLDKSASDIKAAAPSLTIGEIDTMISHEQAGKSRKNRPRQNAASR